MDKQILLYEYEQILLGKKSGFSPYYFKFGDDTSNYYAKYIIKYAVETYLGWTPADTRDHLDQEVIGMLKLEPLIKYLEFPPELDKTKDFYYIASLIYPSDVPVDRIGLVLKTYKRILTGELNKFPKDYLTDMQGIRKARICFRYMLSQYFTFASIRDMYQFFSEPSGSKALRRYKLNGICSEFYECPIDFLHDSLSAAQQDEFWYRYYRFRLHNKAQIRLMKKNQSFTA